MRADSGEDEMKAIVRGLLTLVAVTAVAMATLAQGAPPIQKTAGSSASYDKALLNPATLNAKAPETFDVKFVTTEGEFVVRVHREWAPLGADRCYNLVKHHYFDGAAFFRVLSGFMAQFGLSAYPEVNKAWMNAGIHDEIAKQSNTRGKVSFAMGGPNSRTTQLFINYGNNSGLDKDKFAPFGEVISGMEVVDKLYSGYGEGAPDGRGPDQSRVTLEGKAYLEKNFPKLTLIKSATLVTAPPPAGAATKPSTKP
jgi:peptidyl-prolyl cis-trans isomerase A (cyclophilin A)